MEVISSLLIFEDCSDYENTHLKKGLKLKHSFKEGHELITSKNGIGIHDTSSLRGVRVSQSLVLYVCFIDRCLSFFFWPLCCLFFFDIRILIAPLVS
jgi:hypothetical protein